MTDWNASRRDFLKIVGAGAVAATSSPVSSLAAQIPERVTSTIPSSGEQIPVIGMGTWQTFNVGRDRELRDDRTEVLKEFFAHGGGMIDSSPMYGSSQAVVGYGLEKLGHPDGLIAADKVWTREGGATRESVSSSADKWNVETFDLMQIHNLLSWREHLETLQKMKKEGEIRYLGITTSHGRRHGTFARVMRKHDIDFAQFTYNLVDREVEQRLLPIAKEEGIAVICNRPFRGGSLVDRFQQNDEALPDWAGKWGISNWPQYLLKFIVSHPAVTCAIPATTQVEHMRENMGAARGPMPDAETRKRMLQYANSL